MIFPALATGVGIAIPALDILEPTMKLLGSCTLQSTNTDALSTPDSQVRRDVYRCKENVALDFSEEITAKKVTRKHTGIYGLKAELPKDKALKILQDSVGKCKRSKTSPDGKKYSDRTFFDCDKSRYVLSDWSKGDMVTLSLEERPK